MIALDGNKDQLSFSSLRCQVVAPNQRELGGVAAGKELQQQEGDEEKGEKVAAEEKY